MSAEIIHFPQRLTQLEKQLNSHWADKLEAERKLRAERAAWFKSQNYEWTPGGAA